MNRPGSDRAIDIRSEGPNRDNDPQNKALSANCDQSSDLTIFFARKAFDTRGVRTNTPWNFAKYAKGGFCVVADNPVNFAVEDEEDVIGNDAELVAPRTFPAAPAAKSKPSRG